MTNLRRVVLAMAIGILANTCADVAYAQKGPDSLLLTMLYSSDPIKRADAKKALIKMGPQVVASLIADLKVLYCQDDISGDGRDYLRVNDILDVLVKAGEPSVDPLVEMLSYEALPSDSATGAKHLGPILTRSLVAQALGKLKSTRAVGPLLNLLQTNDVARLGAVKALGELGDRRAVEPLTELLRQIENNPIDVTKGGMLAVEIKMVLRKLN